MKQKNIFAWIAMISQLLFIGCSSWQFASKKADAQAKQFARIPGKASIYVFRAATTNAGPFTLAMGERHHLPQEILVKPLCWLYPDAFLNFEVLEGSYSLMAIDERHGRVKFSDILIGVRPDELYFFKMDDRGIVRVFEAEGKAAVQKCRMVKGQYHE
jgi:hypothetical protein